MSLMSETDIDTTPGGCGSRPSTLSPSRVESFLSCPLAFRFSSIQRLPDPPTPATTKGSLVHRALELLFLLAPAQRTPAALDRCVADAIAEYRIDPDFTELALAEDDAQRFFSECRELAANYMALEDPRRVRDIGLELRLEAPVSDGSRCAASSTGSSSTTTASSSSPTTRPAGPRSRTSSSKTPRRRPLLRLPVRVGVRPASRPQVRLMYLEDRRGHHAVPSAQSTQFHAPRARTPCGRRSSGPVTRGDFRPRPGTLCDYCAFKPWCPAFGGDPAAGRRRTRRVARSQRCTSPHREPTSRAAATSALQVDAFDAAARPRARAYCATTRSPTACSSPPAISATSA